MDPQDNIRFTAPQQPGEPQGAPIGGAPQGAPPPPAYGQQAYGQQPGYAPAPYGAYGAQLPPAIANAQLASWGIRVGASLLDGLFVFFTIGIGWIVNWFLMGREGEKNGMTLGKQVCNIRVVKEDGSPMSTGDGFIREFLVKGLAIGIASTFTLGIVGLLDALWPLWDDKHQALHDKMINQYVVQA